MMSIVDAVSANAALEQTVLLGITTPLSGLSLPADNTGTVVAIISIRLGTLTADPAAGAVVRGNGSNLLWISGTVAQVNAKLATLTYAGSTAGADDLSILVLAANGTLTPAIRSTIAIVPLNSPPTATDRPVSIDGGTLTIESRTLDGPDVNFRELAGSRVSTTGVLINSTLGVNTDISVRNDNSIDGVLPRIAIAGRVELDGSMALAGNGTTVSLAQAATLDVEGSMSIDAHAAQFTGNGTLSNNGRIVVTGDGTSSPTRIDTNLTGSGVMSLVDDASVELGASVGAGETIWLGAGANTLHLAQPSTFAGQIAGFSRGDLLVLDGTTVTSAFASRSTESDDTLVSLLNGALLVGTIRFSAPEPGTIFQLRADAAGNPAIGLAPVANTTASNSVDVFRFFDTAHGTQLLTQNTAERDAIVAGRPDLRYEGVGLHALDPAQPDAHATAVYRFFDVSNGTHLLTASAAERDSLLGSRHDLVFEPSSTLFEHATAQAGDTAVYRFFDTQSGAHFFTADAGEQASILSTRPDMTAEGIAFYAPKV